MTVVLTLSYWVHLISTAIWLGGLSFSALAAVPAWRKQSLQGNQWIALQQTLQPWVTGAMTLLWISGFLQMTFHEQYNGFLALDSRWAWAILLKHIAVFGMMGLSLTVQFRIHPAMQRLELLPASQQAVEQTDLIQQEIKLLRLNLIMAVVVLFFTAVATVV